MFLGHFAVAFAAKKAVPAASLGTLVFAAQFADLLWPVLLLMGLEQVRIVPGLLDASPFDFTSYPISHSLAAELGWGALISAGYYWRRRNVRDALIVGALVPSHWLLDWVAHRPDLPIVPGGHRFGLGMWHSLPLTLAVEYVLFVIGVALYLGTTKRRTVVLWSLVGFLALMLPAALLGPPPTSVTALAASALGLWLVVPWAAWADRRGRGPVG